MNVWAFLPVRSGDGEVVALALIDHADLAATEGVTWRLLAGGYVGTRASYLHRIVAGTPRGMETDHRNGRAWDNRRANLRVATTSQNQQNRRRGYGASTFRGVSPWSDGRWQAKATVAGKQHYLGIFDTEGEAASAAASWRAEHMPFAVETANELAAEAAGKENE